MKNYLGIIPLVGIFIVLFLLTEHIRTDFLRTCIFYLDNLLFTLINKYMANPAFDFIMPIITYAGSTATWIAVVLGLLLLGKKRGALLLLTGLAVSWASVISLKYLIMRSPPLIGRNDPSFPSGHATNVSVGTALLGNEFPYLKWPLFAVSLIVYFSRIYMGTHWPTDVIAGAILGYVVGHTTLRFEHTVNYHQLSQGTSRRRRIK